MTISFYDATVASYLQILGGVANVLAKGEQHANDAGLDLNDIVRYKLRDDMAPFSFQVISVWHHSSGAIKGLKTGLFEPPPKMRGLDYGQLRALVAEATEDLKSETPENIEALADKPMVFRMGSTEIPFTTTNFALSFSLPNFYFHATTTYAILRANGVPLGKTDFLGALRVGA
jgi:hypothetical protein